MATRPLPARWRGTAEGAARRNSAILLSYVLAAVLFAAGTASTAGFASLDHVRSVVTFAAFIGIVGLGQTLCILTGGIDLSIPWVLTGAAVVTATLANGDNSALIVVIPLVLATAAVVGLVNGVGVAYVGAPPIIMTLGMNGALQGLLLVWTNGGTSAAPPAQLSTLVVGDILGAPTMLLVWALAVAGGTILLTSSTLGRCLYAIGSNRSAAFLAGINVRRTVVFPYVISAICAAVAGILLLGFTGGAYLGMGDPYLFASAAAVAVGGASLLGGSGHYVGTVAGALILTLVTSLLLLFSLNEGLQQISYGMILLLTVLLASARVRRS